MNFKEHLISTTVKKDKKGRLSLYPWGVAGPGYVLSGQSAPKVKQFLFRVYSLLFVGVLISVLINKLWLLGVILPSLFIWYVLGVRKIIRNLSRATFGL